MASWHCRSRRRVLYLCSTPYAPGREHGVHPLDAAFGTAWPLDGLADGPTLSPKDAAAPTLDDALRSGVPRSRWGLRSRRRRVLIALAVLFALFCGATARLLIWPTTGMPVRVDAIVVPGGPGDRIAAAIALAERGRTLPRSQAGEQGVEAPSDHRCFVVSWYDNKPDGKWRR
jgi:hypothetical protein